MMYRIGAAIILLMLCTIGGQVFAQGSATSDNDKDMVLRATLNFPFETQWQEVLYVLGEIGLEPKDTVGWLIGVVENETDRQTRIRACEALAIIGPEAADAVEVLNEVLAEREALSDWWLISEAINALNAIGSPANDVSIPIIYEILIENYDFETIATGQKFPGKFDTYTYPEGDREVFLAAYKFLVDNHNANPEKNPHPVKKLLGGIKDLNIPPAKRLGKDMVTQTLVKIGGDSIPFIREALSNQVDIFQCVEVITTMGPAAKDTVPELTDILKNREKYFPETQHSDAIATQVLMALGMIGPDASDAVPLINELAGSDNTHISHSAVTTLGEIHDIRSLPVLIDVLNDDQAFIPRSTISHSFSKGRSALYGLGKFGPDAAEAVPEIIKFLGDDELGWTAAFTLGRIGQPAIGKLTESLINDDPTVRANSAVAFELMGPVAAPVFDILVLRLDDEDDPSAKANLVSAIGQIGRAGLDYAVEDYQAALIKQLDDDDMGIRLSAAYALSKFGALSEAAIPKLLTLALDPYSYEYYNEKYYPVREAAKKAIERIKTDWKPKPKTDDSRPLLCPT